MTSLLAIETSTENCSIALLKNGSTFLLEEKKPQSHGQVILPLIEKIIQKTNIRLTDIDVIAFGRGPGAFTGLRIGIGVVQGLAFGLNCGAIPVSSLQALAQTAFFKTGASFILTGLDARMGDVYFGAFSVIGGIAKPLLDESILKRDQISIPSFSTEWLAVGSGFDAHPKALEQRDLKVQHVPGVYPSAEAVARLGFLAYERGETVKAEKALPVYLRPV